MDKNQKIYCDVYSCAFNNENKEVCELESIKVCACTDCNNGKPEDESMCGSYKQKYTNK